MRLCARWPLTWSAHDDPLVGLAKADGRLDEGVQHRLQVKRRAADHLEHVGRGGLLLQRLAQFINETGILDRDDGLGGETGEQRDLLVSEGTNLLTKDADNSNELIVLEHRYRDCGSHATKLHCLDAYGMAFG